VVYLNPKAAQLLGVNREKVLGRPLILALRDHRLEALALHGGEKLLEGPGPPPSGPALPGRLYLLDQTEAQRRLKDLEEAAVTLAHELRTPLAGMGPLLEALTPRTRQEKEVLDLLKAEVARLARLVEGLSPIRPGPRRPVALEEVWSRLEKLLAERLKGRRVEVHLPHALSTDPEALLQILLNLLDNALKYGQDPIRLLSRLEGTASTWRCGTGGRPFPSTSPSFCREGGEPPGAGPGARPPPGAPPGPALGGRPTPEGRGRERFRRQPARRLRKGGGMREALERL
jgi:signal transduction histidine kinase